MYILNKFSFHILYFLQTINRIRKELSSLGVYKNLNIYWMLIVNSTQQTEIHRTATG